MVQFERIITKRRLKVYVYQTINNNTFAKPYIKKNTFIRLNNE
jgi:hypothetical protein